MIAIMMIVVKTATVSEIKEPNVQSTNHHSYYTKQ